MKKYSWILALLAALTLAFAFTACGGDDDPGVDSSLADLVVSGDDIVLQYAGKSGKAEHVSGNKYILVDQADLSNVGFYYEFPEEVVGKGYGAINIEMEVISIENPDFVGLMTLSKSDFSGPVNVIDKKTGQQKTGQYDNEFKLGEECEKGAAGDTAEGGDGILDGSSKAGVKHDESYPFVKFTDRIAFQVNKYAGNITTAGWTNADTDKATYTIAVTKVTFVGGKVPDSVVDVKAIPGVTPPATGATPVASITETAQFTGTVAWKDAGGTAVGAAFADATVYTATITLEAKEGITFEGVAENFFTVAGATTVTNDKDSGVVTAVFPVTKAPATALTVKVGSATQEVPVTAVGTGSTVAYLNDGSGYTFKYGSNGYGNAYATFSVSLGAGKTLTDFSEVKATFTGIAGDVGWKNILLFAKDTAFTAAVTDDASAGKIGSFSSQQANTSPVALTYDISAVTGISGTTVHFIIMPWAGATGSGAATEFTISDFELVE
jgi:hypothetical protein